MKLHFNHVLALLLAAGLTLPAWGADDPPAKDIILRTELPLKTARSRDPVLGGARDKVFFQVTIPDGVKTVRGAVCNPFSKDERISKHWKAACRHWQFAFVQTDFDAVNKQEYALLKLALAELAKQGNRPEIEHMPLCFTGMSRGGGMSMHLTELLHERTIASVPVCLEVGPTTTESRAIPVLTVFGEKDGKQMSLLLDKLPKERAQAAHWALAVQWARGHEFGQANNLSFVFLDEVIARRLPREVAADKAAPLRELPLEEGWLGDPASWSKDGRRPAIHAWKDYPGERAQACWFPSQRVAAVWQAFVAGTKDVAISEPAGLGDGQQFGEHVAGKTLSVKLALASTLKPEKVELWDGQQRLAERTAAPWNFEVSLQPGIHALYAVVREGQTTRTSRPHTIVVSQ
ncbi:MAG: hypothetical protein JNM56_05175 [Planctomycetia bacterium]|nr:hypothetical protein [Planctomycetia bacterium]